MAQRTEVLVAGGGPAGMMAAIRAAEQGCKVTLLEKNDSCGRKILVTGKGRCNVTNMREWPEFSLHIHPAANFLRPSFYGFSNHALVSYLDYIGLPTVVTQGERVFPQSMRAADVASALVSRLRQVGVELRCGCDVVAVEKEGELFRCTYSCMPRKGEVGVQSIFADCFIIATGGLSYPATGSTGRGYELAKSLGHTVEPLFPSLTALMPSHYDTALVGLELENVGLILELDERVEQLEQGDLSFTSNGIEGSLGYRVSRKAVGALRNGRKVELVLDLKPALSLATLEARLARELDSLGYSPASLGPMQMKTLLRRLMPAQLVNPFVSAHAGADVRNLPRLLKEWRFRIVSYTGYERAVVTAGGVSRKEIVAKNMSSKLVPGLYFAGEVMDVDGDTGGYNLQIAFSTGAMAGQSAAQRILSSKREEAEA